MQTEILQQKDRLQEMMEKMDILNVELIKVGILFAVFQLPKITR